MFSIKLSKTGAIIKDSQRNKRRSKKFDKHFQYESSFNEMFDANTRERRQVVIDRKRKILERHRLRMRPTRYNLARKSRDNHAD